MVAGIISVKACLSFFLSFFFFFVGFRRLPVAIVFGSGESVKKDGKRKNKKYGLRKNLTASKAGDGRENPLNSIF